MKPHHQRCLAPGCFRAAISGYCSEHAPSYSFTAGSKEPPPLSTHKEPVSPTTPLQQTMLTAKPKKPLKELLKERKATSKPKAPKVYTHRSRDRWPQKSRHQRGPVTARARQVETSPSSDLTGVGVTFRSWTEAEHRYFARFGIYDTGRAAIPASDPAPALSTSDRASGRAPILGGKEAGE